MARPRRDGKPSTAPDRRKLSKTIIKALKPRGSPYTVWDTTTRGLVIRVHSRRMTWKVVYSRHGRPRWYHIGDASTIKLPDARTLACKIMLRVGAGEDPQAERRAERSAGTFEDLAKRYVGYAKKKNKSWEQSDALIESYVLPKWAKLQAASISRSDARALMAGISAPITANQVIASTSAIFSWAIREEVGGIKVNPCHGVERNPTKKRDRVLSDSEVPLFWKAFDEADLIRGLALRTILLTGQRPGEVSWMRTEHIKDDWWEMPGELIEGVWPGTKNAKPHRVWLPKVVRDIITLLEPEPDGFVFKNAAGNAIDKLDGEMRDICKSLSVEQKVKQKVTPHDLRRTHGTTITSLGFGRDAMDRVQNHEDGRVRDVYDQYEYAEENKKIMTAVANKLMGLILPAPDNVVSLIKPLKTLKN
jgi:integrase